MNEIETHISKLFEDVPESSRKKEIMQEITQNLNEKLSDLIQTGLPRELAVQKTIEDFGDIDDLKEELEGSARIFKSKKSSLSLAFSIWGSILILGLVLFINLYYTPNVIWFVYPAFAVIWWPMSLYFHWLHIKNDMRIGFAFSLCGFILILSLMLFINFYYTPGTIWFVYPVFGAVWWPLAMLFYTLRQNSRKGEDSDD
jgi:hypothetical protein